MESKPFEDEPAILATAECVIVAACAVAAVRSALVVVDETAGNREVSSGPMTVELVLCLTEGTASDVGLMTIELVLCLTERTASDVGLATKTVAV